MADERSPGSARNGLAELARRDTPCAKRNKKSPANTCFSDGKAFQRVSSTRHGKSRAGISPPAQLTPGFQSRAFDKRLCRSLARPAEVQRNGAHVCGNAGKHLLCSGAGFGYSTRARFYLCAVHTTGE